MDLPFNVDKLAAKRVRAPLPAPSKCRYCAGVVVIAHHENVYGKKSGGRWPWRYVCQDCSASVGMHTGTAIPLGTLANASLREARRRGKAPFSKLERMKLVKRRDLYASLARHLGLHVDRCHFAMFEAKQCEQARVWALAMLDDKASLTTANKERK